MGGYFGFENFNFRPAVGERECNLQRPSAFPVWADFPVGEASGQGCLR